jgi:alpha,alpha-trehalase
MAVQGFERHGLNKIAEQIRSRWVKTVGDLYCREGKVVEKYALREVSSDRTRGGHGGEYPLQDGFGWTNGVTRRWLHEIPDHDVRVGDPAPHDRHRRVAADET